MKLIVIMRFIKNNNSTHQTILQSDMHSKICYVEPLAIKYSQGPGILQGLVIPGSMASNVVCNHIATWGWARVGPLPLLKFLKK